MATADYDVSSQLSGLSRQISALGGFVEATTLQLSDSINSTGEEINRHIATNYDALREIIIAFQQDFDSFVDVQRRANRYQVAETRIIKIRQEIDKKFGHYDVVRRTVTGILQADDLSIVKASTISNVTEELMITTPNYWLAPALVALSAWINDEEEVANRALKEAIHRDDAKTSLLFGLICRRANRNGFALRWIKRYLENQDEQKLGRETVIILDAYTGGLFGNDSDGIVIMQIKDWLGNLSKGDANYKDKQIYGWIEAIVRMKPAIGNKYPNLRKYSKDASTLAEIWESAALNPLMVNYFNDIFQEENESADALKQDLDDLLNRLVSDFDEEEAPLREQERLEQLVIKYEGDEKRAEETMSREKTAFETEQDFTQLLTNAALKPEIVHARRSTRKFAISLSKGWINTAYQTILNQYRAKIPKEINITIDTFSGSTTDGSNEMILEEDFTNLVNREYAHEARTLRMSGFSLFCLPGGGVVTIAGLALLIWGVLSGGSGVGVGCGVVFLIAGIGMLINYGAKKSSEKTKIETARRKYQEKKENGLQTIRKVLAEVVEFRKEFNKNNSKGDEVLTFLEDIRPDKYVKMLDSSQSSIVREMQEMEEND